MRKIFSLLVTPFLPETLLVFRQTIRIYYIKRNSGGKQKIFRFKFTQQGHPVVRTSMLRVKFIIEPIYLSPNKLPRQKVVWTPLYSCHLFITTFIKPSNSYAIFSITCINIFFVYMILPISANLEVLDYATLHKNK